MLIKLVVVHFSESSTLEVMKYFQIQYLIDALTLPLYILDLRYNSEVHYRMSAHTIMLEDWLFVLKMYSLMYDAEKYRGSAEVGFKRLFLDAIYNDGKIQNVYQNMSKKVCRLGLFLIMLIICWSLFGDIPTISSSPVICSKRSK